MFRRASAVTAVLVAVAIVGSGCAGTPAPVETTADALTEEEAFAAAEETYRAYVDALNQVDLSDPETFEPVYAVTTGEANAYFRASFSQMHADGWSVGGLSTAELVELETLRDSSVVDLAVCLNVSSVTLHDATGMSMVDASRPNVQAMRVTLEGPADWKISLIDGRDGPPACEG